MVADIEESWTLQKSIFEDSMQEKCVRHKGVKTLCSVVGGTAKLSGRDYKFQVPTLRREQLVRSEDDLRGEIQGNSERSQPTETKDDL